MTLPVTGQSEALRFDQPDDWLVDFEPGKPQRTNTNDSVIQGIKDQFDDQNRGLLDETSNLKGRLRQLEYSRLGEFEQQQPQRDSFESSNGTQPPPLPSGIGGYDFQYPSAESRPRSNSQPTVTELRSNPAESKKQLEQALKLLDETESWDVVREKFPELWEILREKKDHCYLRKYNEQGSSQEQAYWERTSAFHDTGNQVGPLISLAKVKQLGYDPEEHINKDDRVEFMGATGPGETIGSIKVDFKGDPNSPSMPLTLQVWNDKIGLGEVMFGGEFSGDGLPALLPLLVTRRYRKPSSDETKQMEWHRAAKAKYREHDRNRADNVVDKTRTSAGSASSPPIVNNTVPAAAQFQPTPPQTPPLSPTLPVDPPSAMENNKRARLEEAMIPTQ
ncbi:hypothetical protein QBC35DRAFT_548283 [Podospora australis]|uniref:Uncharacterized protein n=1 Tax=Podospora australis TaxID=1536484 RepID=A0AAN6WYP6_9PEZI|nr:hypothetical protein QBC35DRAFT_548283 [Podospora australis]